MTITTNTPRPGETAEQTAARTAPRGMTYPDAKTVQIVREAKREAFLSVLVEGEEVKRFRLNQAQLHQLNTQSADILMKDFQ